MAKRRVSAAEAEDEPPVAQTPEERRKQRKKDRAARKSGKSGATSQWRRAAYIGVPVVVVIAVVVVLVTLTNANSIPCLQLSGVPVQQSGVPAFPPHNTTDFSKSWCPQGVTTVLASFPLLTVSIQGTNVPLPSSVGRNTSYPGGVECDLPVFTRAVASGYPSGTIYIESPWAFGYNLSTFFSIWSQSYANVFVNTSHASQPIVYQPNDLLGFSADATHAIHLFVDGSPSSAGPSLGIDTLDYGPNSYPSCLAEKYGTGHRVLLTYTGSTTAALGVRGPVGLLATGPADPGANGLLFDSPMPHLGFGAADRTAFAKLSLGSLAWLVGRHAA